MALDWGIESILNYPDLRGSDFEGFDFQATRTWRFPHYEEMVGCDQCGLKNASAMVYS